MTRPTQKEVLAAINMACCMMGGTRDSMQGFCAGMATGISAAFDCLGLKEDYYDPSVLGESAEEREKKILFGALSVIEQYNTAMEHDAVYEDMIEGKLDPRAVFRKKALESYSEFISKERRPN
jgi:hypothetical protein